MKNRYNDLLRKNNQNILALCPYNPILFRELAFQIEKFQKKNARFLEIGCGEGDSAILVLENTKRSIDLLDISPEMIKIAKRNLRKFSKRVKYICSDALKYLNLSQPYDVIYSAWTVHNFKQKDKEALLQSIYDNLAPGGVFILADKVYRDRNWKEPMEIQNKRYRDYLDKDTADAIIEHEEEDASDIFRMEEKSFKKMLSKIGFLNIEIKDRVERDVLLLAKK